MAKGNFELVGGRWTHFGGRGLDAKYGRPQSRVGHDVELVYEFDYNDLPTASDVNEMIHTIPEGSHITEATFTVLEAFAGTDGSDTGSFMTIGLQEGDGTEIDNDGLVVVGALTSIDAEHDLVVGSGALVGTAIPEKGQVVVTLDGDSTLTAGKGKIFIKYRAPEAVAAGQREY